MTARREQLLLSKGPFALLHDADLFGHVAQSVDHHFVTVDKGKQYVRDPGLTGELLNESLRTTKIMAWETWKKVMDGLEL